MRDDFRFAQNFINTLERLQHATVETSPAALHNSVKRILERTKGFEGNEIDELINFIASPPKKKPTKKNSAASSSKKRAYSDDAKREMLDLLVRACTDELAFNGVIEDYRKTYVADVVKKAAAEFAAADTPNNLESAIKLLKSERANRIRTERKIEDSGASTPW